MEQEQSRTCIAALVDDEGTIFMGGDGCVTMGWTVVTVADKIWAKEGILYGGTGFVRPIQVVQHIFARPDMNVGEDAESYLVGRYSDAMRRLMKSSGCLRISDEKIEHVNLNLLIGFSSQIWFMGADCSFVPMTIPIAAVGCGDHLALGSLFSTQDTGLSPRERILKALEAASHFSPYVSAPHMVMKLEDGADEAEIVYQEEAE